LKREGLCGIKEKLGKEEIALRSNDRETAHSKGNTISKNIMNSIIVVR